MSKSRSLPIIALLALAATSPAHADVCPVGQLVAAGTPNARCVIQEDTTSFPSNPILDLGDLDLRIRSGRTLLVAASLTSAGTLTLKAGGVVLENGASIVIRPDAAGNGGHLALVAKRSITLESQGTGRSAIDASADTTGGRIDLVAGGDVLLKGLLRAAGTPGSGGEINITAGGKITVQGSDLVQAPGGLTGVGGSVMMIGGGPVFLDSSIDASGNLSGGSLDLESGGDFTTTPNAPLLVSSVDTGGDVFFQVRGSVTIGAKIDQSGHPGADFGGSGGELDMLVDGDITFNAPLDQSGTPPDGAGGLVNIEAGGSIIQNATAPLLAGGGNGTDSGGGSVDLTAGKDILLGAVDVSGGGFGGGSIDVESQGTTTVAGIQNADGVDAGDIIFVGLTVRVEANVHAAAEVAGAGGTISIAACTLAVPAEGALAVTGDASGALLRASGLMTIAGSITSVGTNIFQYLDTLPVIQGSAVIQPPTAPLRNAALPSCDNFFPTPTTTTTTVPGATTTTTSTVVSSTTITTTTIPFPTTTSTSTSTSFTTTSSTATTSTSSSTSTSSVTSSSVVTSTSSSTTSTRPECSASDTCDDHDGCTVDSCADGRCLHDPKIGADSVTCILEKLDADLTEAGAGNLGGPARMTALRGKVGKGRSLVDASRTLTGRKLLKKLKAANKQVGAFSKLVQRGQTQKKIAAALADRLLGLATDTSTQLQQLMTP